MKKCCFDNDGVCGALACYSAEKCGSRDEKGNPIYGDTKPVLRGDLPRDPKSDHEQEGKEKI